MAETQTVIRIVAGDNRGGPYLKATIGVDRPRDEISDADIARLHDETSVAFKQSFERWPDSIVIMVDDYPGPLLQVIARALSEHQPPLIHPDFPGDERIAFYEALAGRVIHALDDDADLVPGNLAQRFKDERNIARQPHNWARLLVERDSVQGPKVLERMIEYYDKHDGGADDFGRLFIVQDASRALGRE